jgi:hypothetical protein
VIRSRLSAEVTTRKVFMSTRECGLGDRRPAPARPELETLSA